MVWLGRRAANSSRTKRPSESSKQSLPAFSYHNVRNEQETGFGRNQQKLNSKQTRRTRVVWLEKFGLIILLIVAVVCLISVLYLSTTPQVMLEGKTSSLYSGYTLKVKQAAGKLLSSSVLNTNKITVNTAHITSILMTEFPEYSNISVTIPLINHHAIIYLIPSTPSLLLQTVAGQFVINQNGYAMSFAPNDKSVKSLNLPQVTDEGSNGVTAGKQILTSQEVSFIQTVDIELNLRGDKVVKMDIPQATTELDIHLMGKSYYGKFNLEENNSRVQAGTFLATEHYLISQNTPPGQYIDVRTDGRAYFK